MTLGTWLMTLWGASASLLWIVLYLRATWSLGRLRLIADAHPPQPRPVPRLSVVITAKDEADTLEPAMATLLAQDFPDLEIVIVNDRSTDATSSILLGLATRDARIRPVTVTTLPDGWLGKVNALHAGAKVATGEWILFTDADVHFAPGVLRKAVALCVDEKLDHLVLGPRMHASSFWLEVTVAAFGGLFLAGTRAADVGRPGSDAYVGAGAFNLVRRAAFDRTEGFPWLRMELADDVGLGLALHRAGARSAFLLAPTEIGVTWYPSLAAMARGLEKNMFGVVGRFSVVRTAALTAFFWFCNLGPFVAFASPLPRLWVMPLLAVAALIVAAAAMRQRHGPRFRAVLLAPVGQLIISVMIVRSAVVCLRRGAVVWRGTAYALDELRRGQRVRI